MKNFLATLCVAVVLLTTQVATADTITGTFSFTAQGDHSSSPPGLSAINLADADQLYDRVDIKSGSVNIKHQSGESDLFVSTNLLDHTDTTTQTWRTASFFGGSFGAGDTLNYSTDLYFDPDADDSTNNAVVGNFSLPTDNLMISFYRSGQLQEMFTFSSSDFSTDNGITSADFSSAAVPEPGSLTFLGLVGLGFALRRRR